MQVGEKIIDYNEDFRYVGGADLVLLSDLGAIVSKERQVMRIFRIFHICRTMLTGWVTIPLKVYSVNKDKHGMKFN